MKTRRYIRFFGSVQGVGFRYYAQSAANAYAATGFVRNEYDGSVSMEIQGSEEQIDAVIAALDRGTYIRIEDMQVRTIPLVEDERDFRIVR